MKPLTDLKAITIYVLALLVLLLGLSTWSYRRMFRATDYALTTQNAAIERNNKTARDLLTIRTAERDAIQAKLNERATAQGKTDEKVVTRIAADDRLQRSAPVRVRVRDCARDAGGGSGGAAGQAATAAEAGTGDVDPAGGLLSEAGARRLADALTEIEMMSAAYASCKGGALGLSDETSPVP